jgi:NAD-dependent deacetylase
VKYQSVAALTGAGISAESGVPTFRGPDGLWKNYRAEELATPSAFRKDPRLVWEWYEWRRGLIAKCQPNTAHYTLAEMEQAFASFTLITQNVDGLHRLAGSRKVVELHGNIWRVRCTQEGTTWEERTVPLRELPPRCSCGALLRPDVVWFGEPLPEATLQAVIRASESCELMLVIGTSAVVQPAASLPLIAKRNGAFLVEINPQETPLTSLADVSLRGPAAVELPLWWVEQSSAH